MKALLLVLLLAMVVIELGAVTLSSAPLDLAEKKEAAAVKDEEQQEEDAEVEVNEDESVAEEDEDEGFSKSFGKKSKKKYQSESRTPKQNRGFKMNPKEKQCRKEAQTSRAGLADSDDCPPTEDPTESDVETDDGEEAKLAASVSNEIPEGVSDADSSEEDVEEDEEYENEAVDTDEELDLGDNDNEDEAEAENVMAHEDGAVGIGEPAWEKNMEDWEWDSDEDCPDGERIHSDEEDADEDEEDSESEEDEDFGRRGGGRGKRGGGRGRRGGKKRSKKQKEERALRKSQSRELKKERKAKKKAEKKAKLKKQKEVIKKQVEKHAEKFKKRQEEKKQERKTKKEIFKDKKENKTGPLVVRRKVCETYKVIDKKCFKTKEQKTTPDVCEQKGFENTRSCTRWIPVPGKLPKKTKVKRCVAKKEVCVKKEKKCVARETVRKTERRCVACCTCAMPDPSSCACKWYQYGTTKCHDGWVNVPYTHTNAGIKKDFRDSVKRALSGGKYAPLKYKHVKLNRYCIKFKTLPEVTRCARHADVCEAKQLKCVKHKYVWLTEKIKKDYIPQRKRTCAEWETIKKEVCKKFKPGKKQTETKWHCEMLKEPKRVCEKYVWQDFKYKPIVRECPCLVGKKEYLMPY